MSRNQATQQNEVSASMWTNVDNAMDEMLQVLLDVMSEEQAKTFMVSLEKLITQLVKAPPRGANHPSRNKT